MRIYIVKQVGVVTTRRGRGEGNWGGGGGGGDLSTCALTDTDDGGPAAGGILDRPYLQQPRHATHLQKTIWMNISKPI